MDQPAPAIPSAHGRRDDPPVVLGDEERSGIAARKRPQTSVVVTDQPKSGFRPQRTQRLPIIPAECADPDAGRRVIVLAALAHRGEHNAR
jgi:hypothetical protein